MKKIWALLSCMLLLPGAFGAPLCAQLRYTVLVESHPVVSPTPVDPMFAAMGLNFLKNMLPNGSFEMTFTVVPGGARVEWNKAMPGIPAGAVLLRPVVGPTVMLDPKNKTYWKVTLRNFDSLAVDQKPEVKRQEKADGIVIAGAKAGHGVLEIRIPLPGVLRGEASSGTPADPILTGDIWTTDRYSSYLTVPMGPVISLGVFGLGTVPTGHLMLRQVLRGQLLGNQELECLVTMLTVLPMLDVSFEIPAGYKEIPQP